MPSNLTKRALFAYLIFLTYSYSSSFDERCHTVDANMGAGYGKSRTHPASVDGHQIIMSDGDVRDVRDYKKDAVFRGTEDDADDDHEDEDIFPWSSEDEDDGEEKNPMLAALGLTTIKDMMMLSKFTEDEMIPDPFMTGVVAQLQTTLNPSSKKYVRLAYWCVMIGHASFGFDEELRASILLAHGVDHLTMMALLNIPFTDDGMTFYQEFMLLVARKITDGNITQDELENSAYDAQFGIKPVVQDYKDFASTYDAIIQGDDDRIHEDVLLNALRGVNGMPNLDPDAPMFGLYIAAVAYLRKQVLDDMELSTDEHGRYCYEASEDDDPLFPGRSDNRIRFNDSE